MSLFLICGGLGDMQLAHERAWIESALKVFENAFFELGPGKGSFWFL